MLDKSSRHTASDMLEGDKYLQLDLQERMEVGCRWQADVPRGVRCVRFEKCNLDGSGRLNQEFANHARSAETARLASLCYFSCSLRSPSAAPDGYSRPASLRVIQCRVLVSLS